MPSRMDSQSTGVFRQRMDPVTRSPQTASFVHFLPGWHKKMAQLFFFFGFGENMAIENEGDKKFGNLGLMSFEVHWVYSKWLMALYSLNTLRSWRLARFCG